MNIITYLLQPILFLSLLTVLFVLSVIVAVSAAQKDRRQIVSLRMELEKTREELAVKNQMYEGLKGQYDELEKDFEKASQPAPSRPSPAAPVAASAATNPIIPSAPAQPQAPSVKLDQSIADLLQKIPGSQTKTP